ncbi:hypothetical protein C0J52_20450, partial [Blattella germanica]
ATSGSPQLNLQGYQPTATGVTARLIIKPVNSNLSSNNITSLIRESVDPRALQVGISKMKNLANNAILVECQNKNDCEILEKEIKKITVIQTEKPKKKLPTMLIKYVPKDVTDAELKNTLLHQNNLSHLEESEMNIKFTKKTFDDSRHLVIEVSPNLRREILTLNKIKLNWCVCSVEDFILVTRCFKCLGFGHTSKFCEGNQTCVNCAEEHHWKECDSRLSNRCTNCMKASAFIKDDNKKLSINHSAFSNECPRLHRIQGIKVSKTEY